MNVRFNIPFKHEDALKNIAHSIAIGKTSGNHEFSKACHHYFNQQLQTKSLLTTSCTDALEMIAILANIKPGDEVIMPSYTFVSTANPFLLRGATLRFVDSNDDHPNMDEQLITPLINERTKAIVVVHYGGVACAMDAIMAIADKHDLLVIEDAAQCLGASYREKPLGSIGHAGAFSFHESKNISCGEGGLLAVNHKPWQERAEVLWEKGTNRAAFWRGEIDKYGWVDVGSSFLMSDILAGYLLSQLDHLTEIQTNRLRTWQYYYDQLQNLSKKYNLALPNIPLGSAHNGHIFYVIAEDERQRNDLMQHLKQAGIESYFHYQSLHNSQYFKGKHDGRALPNAERYTDCLLRLPLHYYLTQTQQDYVIEQICTFYA